MSYIPVPARLDDSAFGIGTDSVSPIGQLADETGPDTVDEGDVGISRMSLDRIAYSRVQDGHNVGLGATTDADTANTVIGRLKQLLTRLPAALVGGRLDTNVGAIPGTVSTNNSTTATLGVSAVFTGTSDEVKDYAAVTLNIEASHVSATDGISIEWSNDGTNWDRAEKYTYRAASQDFSVTLRPKGRYYRLVYTNGGTGQTTFRLQSLFHPSAPFVDTPLVNGRMIVDGMSYPVKQAAINATASGDNTVIALVSGKRLRILFLMHTGDEAYKVTYKSGASTTLVSEMAFGNAGGPGVNPLPYGYLMETAVGEAFVMSLDDAANVRGVVNYVELP